MSMKGQRIWRRQSVAVPVWITSLDNGGVFELTMTENISPRGVRVVTRKCWNTYEQVLVSAPPEFSSVARIVYCQPLPSEDFALGISLKNPVLEGLIELQGPVPLNCREAASCS
jgi:hypothetical protein